jgi:hypothetical protein
MKNKWMEEVDIKLKKYLKDHGVEFCPKCNKEIDRYDIAWNNSSTGWTPVTVVEIQCQKCDNEIAHFESWYPCANDLEELVYNVFYDWR